MALSIWCFLADHGFEIHCQIRWKCVHWWASRCLHKCSCSTCFQSQKFNSLEGQRFWRLLHRCHHQLILLVTCGWWLAKVLSCASIAKLLIGAPSCQWVTIPSSLDIMSLQGLHWQIVSHGIVWYCMVLLCILWYCIVLHVIALYRMVLQGIVLLALARAVSRKTPTYFIKYDIQPNISIVLCIWNILMKLHFETKLKVGIFRKYWCSLSGWVEHKSIKPFIKSTDRANRAQIK